MFCASPNFLSQHKNFNAFSVELVSKDLNHLAAILHVYAGGRDMHIECSKQFKLVLVEIGYVVPISTNFALYDFFQIPKIVLSEDPLYI